MTWGLPERACCLWLLTLLPSCFNPENNSASGGDDGSTTAAQCSPGDTEACTCEDGQCGSTGSEPTTDQPDSSGDDGSTGMPECSTDEDCDALDDECTDGVCNDAGTCEAEPITRGTACGSSTSTSCDAADSCDGAGNCVQGLAPVGLPCAGCGEDVCACDGAGACGPCPAFVQANDFATARSIDGWTLTGGWGLYAASPQSLHPSVEFPSRVFGTDGNRFVPYPLGGIESSTATSRELALPSTITFSSWHLDEGGAGCNFDRKSVFASIDDGASWVALSDCCTPGLDAAPYCVAVLDAREGDAFDDISLPVPADMIGSVGLIQFRYDTVDDCCGEEQGWYIDASNLGTECECGTDLSCDGESSSDCGAGVCGGDGQCSIDAVAAGTSCGDVAAATCSDPDSCNAFGLCLPQDLENGPGACEECPSSVCGGCVDGDCVDCPSQEYDVFDFSGWLVEPFEGTTDPGWGVYYEAPPNLDPGSTFTSFGTRAPVFGTDGNRLSPYTPPNSHLEVSAWTTASFTVPASITFESWNQDEGGGGSPDSVDYKRIDLSVDGGATWMPIADCAVDAHPFCVPTADRPIDVWDPIELDTSAWEGMSGQLRFFYDTQDACCDNERGWYINDLNVLTVCFDPIPAP